MNYIGDLINTVPTNCVYGAVGGAILGAMVGGPVGGAVGLLKMGGAYGAASRLVTNFTTQGPLKSYNPVVREIGACIRVASAVLIPFGVAFYLGAAPATFAATAGVLTAVALAPRVGKFLLGDVPAYLNREYSYHCHALY